MVVTVEPKLAIEKKLAQSADTPWAASVTSETPNAPLGGGNTLPVERVIVSNQAFAALVEAIESPPGDVSALRDLLR